MRNMTPQEIRDAGLMAAESFRAFGEALRASYDQTPDGLKYLWDDQAEYVEHVILRRPYPHAAG